MVSHPLLARSPLCYYEPQIWALKPLGVSVDTMDPFTAIGLASNIISFIDFGCKLLSSSKDMYNSLTGASSEIDALNLVSDNLSSLCSHFADDDLAAPRIYHDPELVRLTGECKSIADQIQGVVGDLSHGAQKGKWRSFAQAMRERGKQGQLQTLASRLDRLQASLNTRLLFLMRYAGC